MVVHLVAALANHRNVLPAASSPLVSRWGKSIAPVIPLSELGYLTKKAHQMDIPQYIFHTTYIGQSRSQIRPTHSSWRDGGHCCIAEHQDLARHVPLRKYTNQDTRERTTYTMYTRLDAEQWMRADCQPLLTSCPTSLLGCIHSWKTPGGSWGRRRA